MPWYRFQFRRMQIRPLEFSTTALRCARALVINK